MAAAGTWSITVESPMGEQKSTATLQEDGTTLTGSTSDPYGESVQIYDGKVNGDAFSFKIDVTTPMPMTLAFEGAVTGDTVKGNVAAGAFGSFPFTGNRA